ncbi:prepilin-type N-terminal cleavage/methylation domain-containing protein [Campylobacter geochelonis]|uniref:prepilin-type N-terminal cleavage/methylation domain-containing protein n=1 Tax=Campylobacter geochelonis TaxID=1780362 RepID=UPI000770A613|nr:prepilin-type N-terminal cleavage/methylation domain-containing protein [Campylobacter geochelonis]CZE47741.1 carbamoyl-phosphate synthase large subunit [Campylobacter geochelonis]CZE50897.1 carbamoyl-phosphate synthase large subunit [Campylobacter geochelonis]
MKTVIYKAFTLMELVLVIVVVGILSALVIPRLERNAILEASNQIVSHIRYTQHLAMMDNKFNANDATWFKSRWTIAFNNGNSWRYDVFQDKNHDGAVSDIGEVAKDPQNPNRVLSSGFTGAADSVLSKKMNLGNKFGVTGVVFGGSCAGTTGISFDEKGRPMLQVSTAGGATNPVDRMITGNDGCTIAINNDDGKRAVITIRPETGYVSAVNPTNP